MYCQKFTAFCNHILKVLFNDIDTKHIWYSDGFVREKVIIANILDTTTTGGGLISAPFFALDLSQTDFSIENKSENVNVSLD